ncbi:prolipoprotein diacylglyceryl transferase [Mycoplasma todarodis]|uniref:Phosphatidylglycerol--prolipoprotein diacylglyceryl transferase n=1 Tax=Mycoplasma todarodis TaxID=1937191 RepID=A0A4R0XKH5_9MOLU|nr:prolipoprotein diacylglyceryl transferase [Mycoplasma todarodis]TCG11156.1 prolipoprotein diacylglyceryl transferase [Mycoplasma todarodis]
MEYHKAFDAHEPATAFSIGSFDVKVYSLTMMFGMLFSILGILYYWKKQKYSIEALQILTLIVIPCSLIGARVWYVLGNLDSPATPPDGWGKHWFAAWEGGMAIQGGVMGAILGGFGYVWSKRRILDPRTVLTYVVPAVLIGQAIGRWGNFANHEVYGKVDETGVWSSWMGDYIHSNMFIRSGDGEHYRVPLFFYEFMTSVVGFIILHFVMNTFNWTKPGVTAGGYFAWYGTVRIIMEPLRDPSDYMYWFDGKVEASVFTSAIFIIAGILLILYSTFDKYVRAFFTNWGKNMAVKGGYVDYSDEPKRKSEQRSTNFKKGLKAFWVSSPFKGYKETLNETKPKYTRIKIEQRYFFITWPLKTSVFVVSAFKGMFTSANYKEVKQQMIEKYANYKPMSWRFKSHIWVREHELVKFEEGYVEPEREKKNVRKSK